MSVNYSKILFTKKVNCALDIYENTITLTGIFPLACIRKATSFYVKGFQYSDAYKCKKWDGREHLFNQKNNTFPAGLLFIVINALKKYDKEASITINDKRENFIPNISNNNYGLIGINFGEGKYSYQKEAANKLVEKKRGILKAATNSGKTEIAAAIIKRLKIPTIFLVDGLELLYQTRERFSKRLNIPIENIGIIGDQQFYIGNWITISTPRSFQSRYKKEEINTRYWKMLFADECHRSSADTFYNVLNILPCYYRFGMSGTPLNRSDGSDLKLIAQTGPIIYEISNKFLVENGISVQPYVHIVKITKPIIPKDTHWKKVKRLGIVENKDLNNKIINLAFKFIKKGKQVIIFIEEIKHGNELDRLMLLKSFEFQHQFIYGEEEISVRKKAIDDFKNRKIKCLITSKILREGVDIPCVDVLIFASGGKSVIDLLQKSGRGLRTNNKKDSLIIVDFANFTHRYLLKHSLERLRTYKNEECFIIKTRF